MGADPDSGRQPPLLPRERRLSWREVDETLEGRFVPLQLWSFDHRPSRSERGGRLPQRPGLFPDGTVLRGTS